MEPHSAKAQFYINLADSEFLDHTGKNPKGWGNAVFGEVIEGKEVVDAIAAVSTGTKNGREDVPDEDVVIERAEIIG
ncbi:peptidylprolyl isomerase [Streptomyces sp. NPDC053253]|uniref:peptidylprolyl isomerase n=1 Tax=Streptomyces sp. NPDC053253 TaxID=3365699 RepID=UPI0037D337AB